jgi:hypothetical protein
LLLFCLLLGFEHVTVWGPPLGSTLFCLAPNFDCVLN